MQQDYDFPDYPELTELLHEQSLLGLDSSPDSVNIPIIKFNSQTHKPISLPNNFPVTALAFSNNLIYAALANGDILEYSIDSNLHSQPTKILRLHSDKVTAIVASFSHLYSASIDSKIVIWDLQTGDPVKTIIGHTGPVLSLCLTDQGKLYSGGHDKTINEWDPRSGRRKWILTGSKGAIYALTSSFTCPNTLFSAGEDQVIRAWDTTSGRCVQTFNGHEGPVMALKIKDNLLYSASRDGSVAIWHALDGGLIDTMSSNNNLPITALEIFNNSLFTGSEALSIIQWDLTDRSPIATFSGHTATVTALAVYADKLISTSTDGTIKLWKLDKLSTVAATSSSSLSRNNRNSKINGRRGSFTDDFHRFDGTSDAGQSRHSMYVGSPTNGAQRSGSVNGRPVSISGFGTRPGSTINDNRVSGLNAGNRNSMYAGSVASTGDRNEFRNDNRNSMYAGSFVSGTNGKKQSAPSYISETYSVESFHSMQEQLSKAQDLLNKQERNKLRLKGELSGTRSELAQVKTELADLKKQLNASQGIIEELEVAKDLLVTYNSELQNTQDAYNNSLNLIFKSCDHQYKMSSFELSSFKKLVDDQSHLYPTKTKKIDRIEAQRVWEYDSDWDSDCDNGVDQTWWRRKQQHGKKDPLADYFFPTVTELALPTLSKPAVLKKPKLENKKSLSDMFMKRMFTTSSVPKMPIPVETTEPVDEPFVKINYKPRDQKRFSTPEITTKPDRAKINRQSMAVPKTNWLNPLTTIMGTSPRSPESPLDATSPRRVSTVKVRTEQVYRFDDEVVSPMSLDGTSDASPQEGAESPEDVDTDKRGSWMTWLRPL